MLEEFEFGWVNKCVTLEWVSWEIREWLQTFDDCLKVEVLHYVPQSLIRISELLVMKIRCREIRWWWIPNRKEHVFLGSSRSFLWLRIQIGIVFWFLMWWFVIFGNMFQDKRHCFFQGSGMLAVVNCLYSTPEFHSGWILDKDAVNRNFTSAGALSQVCLGLPAVTTLDNDGTLWFWILDNCLD